MHAYVAGIQYTNTFIYRCLNYFYLVTYVKIQEEFTADMELFYDTSVK